MVLYEELFHKLVFYMHLWYCSPTCCLMWFTTRRFIDEPEPCRTTPFIFRLASLQCRWTGTFQNHTGTKVPNADRSLMMTSRSMMHRWASRRVWRTWFAALCAQDLLACPWTRSFSNILTKGGIQTTMGTSRWKRRQSCGSKDWTALHCLMWCPT